MIRKIKRLYYLLQHLAHVTGYIKSGNVFLGKNVRIEPGVELYTDSNSLITIGDNVFIGSNCRFSATRRSKIRIKNHVLILPGTEIRVRESVDKGGVLHIGERTVIQRNNIIDITGNVYIGEDVKTGEGCYIHTHTHNYDKPGLVWDQGIRVGNVRIERGCWIGTNVQIMPNVTIGEGAIIGAGSIVTDNIDPYTVAAGVPAKKIRKR